MKKIITIVGARPQIIKASAISRVIQHKFSNQLEEIIIHTGQHYDENMSTVFFEELNIPLPKYNLEVGEFTPSEQLSKMITGIDEIIQKEKPDFVIVYGDTNSTLAGAISASKSQTLLIHIEAGLRSFNRTIPEELNRVLTDHASNILFTPTEKGLENLLSEMKIYSDKKIYKCGDIMYDNSLFFSAKSKRVSTILNQLDLINQSYFLLTIHRNSNTDELVRLKNILSGVLELIKTFKKIIVFPIHPRTKKALEKLDASFKEKVFSNPYLNIIEPASFIDMIALEQNAELIITDSGGVQKEAYFFKIPCLVLRNETEWVEIVDSKNAFLVDDSSELLINYTHHFLNSIDELNWDPIFGDGNAAEFIIEKILSE